MKVTRNSIQARDAAKTSIGPEEELFGSGTKANAAGSPSDRSRPSADVDGADPMVGQTLGTTESRRCPLTGGWTIFAPERQHRPNECVPPAAPISQHYDCPFCSGNESKTPAAVWTARLSETDETAFGETHRVRVDPAHHDPQTGHVGRRSNVAAPWSIRVVPNMYPAVTRPPVPGKFPYRHRQSELFEQRSVGGYHEVVIESPDHVRSVSQLDVAEVELIFKAYAARLHALRQVESIRYVSIFKNVGGEAGASLHHSHSQIIATDQIPSHVQQVCDRMRSHFARRGCCLQCDLVRGELLQDRRVVAKSPRLIAYCPFASPMPMMVRITSLQHHARFETLDAPTREEVARMTQRVIRWLESLLGGMAYNYILHTRPPAAEGDDQTYHWSLDIIPRVTSFAGFELGTGSVINPIMPEAAAESLRHCAAEEDPRRALR